ncbi:MAG: biotin-dependent carboxyltransferase family protein, partial [Pseudomonadota bacterium]
APALRVLEPGLATTLQDLGRGGFQRFGVPPSGALDPGALRLANALVGAQEAQAGLEIRFLGPVLAAEDGPVRLALAGAAASMLRMGIDGTETPIPDGRSLTLAPGERLRIGALSGSSTAYLALSPGFDVAAALGSRATLARAGLGGFAGRGLAAGDRLALLPGTPEGPELALPPADAADRAAPGSPSTVRVVLGPQDDLFTEDAVRAFLTADWRITKDADRMGLRLEGPRLSHRAGADIVSDGIETGAVQVPGTGQPILLLADRQTSGGYAKIAAAIRADLPLLGRLAPSAVLRFVAVSPVEGAAALRAAESSLRRRIAGIAPVGTGPSIDLEALYRENLITGQVEGD